MADKEKSYIPDDVTEADLDATWDAATDEVRRLATRSAERILEERYGDEVAIHSAQLHTRARFGFWRLLWRALLRRCLVCGGHGFTFSMHVNAGDGWFAMSHACACPGCGAGPTRQEEPDDD